MKILRERWIEFYPVMFGIAFMIGLLWIIIIGVNRMANAIINQENKPDPRTVNEILDQKYKNCIIQIRPEKLEDCKVYLNAKQ